VKSTARRKLSDAAHLRTFRAEYGKKARAGFLSGFSGPGHASARVTAEDSSSS
jgi:hypothetical protein